MAGQGPNPDPTCLLALSWPSPSSPPAPSRCACSSDVILFMVRHFYRPLLLLLAGTSSASFSAGAHRLDLCEPCRYTDGGMDSSLNFLYPMVIIVASILLPRIWAHLVAALAFILYGAVLGTQLLRSCNFLLHKPSRPQNAAGNHFCQSVCLCRGGLSGRPAQHQVRQARVKLSKASGELENLQILHENIIQSIGSGLITTGLDGHITLVNTAAQKLLEAPPVNSWASPSTNSSLDRFPDRVASPRRSALRR